MNWLSRTGQAVIVGILVASLSGCLGTSVRTPAPAGKPHTTTNAHILASPYRVDAHTCHKGLAQVTRAVPLWGVAVGILTFGIVVPMATQYRCVE